jgi:hypothetical protein
MSAKQDATNPERIERKTRDGGTIKLATKYSHNDPEHRGLPKPQGVEK